MVREHSRATQPPASFVPLTGFLRRRRGSAATGLVAAMAILASVTNTTALADVFYLSTGATIEGDLVDETGEKTRIMLTNGSVVLFKKDIVRREASPTTLQRYEAEKAKRTDTAQGEYDLGVWCDQNGLAAEARSHYRAALTRDPAMAPAARALGYVAVGDAWLDGSPSVLPSKAPSTPLKSEQPLLDEIVREWFRRIHAIRYAYLNPPSDRPGVTDERRFSEGRDQVRAIKDPLAIPALTHVLSESPYRTRYLLVEVLSRFPQDDATLNLLAIALLDPDPAIRSAAAAALIDRKDPRVETELRKALRTGDENLVRRAATALGVLKARGAVGDLIAQLTPGTSTTSTRPRQTFLSSLPQVFNKPTTAELGGRTYRRSPTVGICDSFAAASAAPVRTVRKTGGGERPEVQEALTAITGEKFGLDAEAWRRWDKEHPATRPAGARP